MKTYIFKQLLTEMDINAYKAPVDAFKRIRGWYNKWHKTASRVPFSLVMRLTDFKTSNDILETIHDYVRFQDIPRIAKLVQEFLEPPFHSDYFYYKDDIYHFLTYEIVNDLRNDIIKYLEDLND